MGVDYSVYLGPYIVAKNSREEVTKTRRSCTNANCKEATKQVYDAEKKFCPTCGTAIGDVAYTTTAPKVGAWEIAEEQDLCVVPTEYMKDVDKGTNMYIPNVTGVKRKFSCDARKERIAEVTPELIADELAAFTVFYEKGIAALHAAYGQTNVTIHWGLIQYGS
jgi:hypothetical protein